MRTEENRGRYARPTARYESDVTDPESAEIGIKYLTDSARICQV